ncbi:MAG: AzlD domain-containing protein [Chloroflexi bacterium]|nr:AzlD domain-containing protein [Chloroflexota bacterium]
MTSIWLTMVAVGVLTFATRLSFIAILERWKTPPVLQRALRFVPAAVLAAIIVPELALYDGTLDAAPVNPRLLAGAVAMIVAWKTKNVVWTIIAGMGVLLVLQYFL